MSNQSSTTRAASTNGLVSDLVACYHDLLAGVCTEELLKKYVAFDVRVAEELYEKGTTQEELARFQERRTAALEAARTHEPLVCECGLALYDLDEYRRHVALNPSIDSILQEPSSHKLRRGRL